MRQQAIVTSIDGSEILPAKSIRKETWRALFAGLAIALDALALVAGFRAVELFVSYHWLVPGGMPLLTIVIPAHIYLGLVFSGYKTSTLASLSNSASAVLRAFVGALIVVIVCAFLAKFGMKISRSAFFYAMGTSTLTLFIARAIIAVLIQRVMPSGIADRLLVTSCDRKEFGKLYGVDVIDLDAFGLRPDLNEPTQMAMIADIICRYDVVYLDGENITDVQAWTTALKSTGVACEVLIPQQLIHSAVGIGHLGTSDTLILSRGPLSFGSRLQKRMFDLVVTIPLIVILSPVMIAAAIAIRLESPGPALFTQTRIGRASRPFQIFKFRSMRQDQLDERGDRSTSRDDDRITRVGRFIRKTSIDELPQLFNVVMGDMSLIGPRPHAEGSRAGEQLFWEVSELYWMRHALKPGITGLAQIHGYRGATHNREDLESRLRYDLEYLQTWSLWNDIAILFATVKVLSHDNAY